MVSYESTRMSRCRFLEFECKYMTIGVLYDRFSTRFISNFGILSVPKARLGLRLLGACARRIPPAAHGHRWATMDVSYTTYAHFKRPPLQTLDCVLMLPLMKGSVIHYTIF